MPESQKEQSRNTGMDFFIVSILATSNELVELWSREHNDGTNGIFCRVSNISAAGGID
jgi:hypothetical protein